MKSRLKKKEFLSTRGHLHLSKTYPLNLIYYGNSKSNLIQGKSIKGWKA